MSEGKEKISDLVLFISKCLNILDEELTRSSNKEPSMSAEALLCPVLNAKAALDKLYDAYNLEKCAWKECQDISEGMIKFEKQEANRRVEELAKNSNVVAILEALKNLTKFEESDISQLETLANRAIDNDIYGGGILQAIIEAIRDGKKALLTPPRNCDRFNSGDKKKDAQDAMMALLDEGVAGYRGIAEWLLDTAQEGDKK